MINFYTTLQKNPLFYRTDNVTLKKALEKQTSIRAYDSGQYIVHEHDTCDFIAFVLEGKVQIHKQYVKGDLLTIHLLEENAIFGAAILFASQNTFHYAVSSKSQSKIIFIRKKAIDKLLALDLTFSKNYITFLSDRLFVFKDIINILRLKDVRSKLIVYLLSERQKYSRDTFTLSNTREEIANIIGVTRPSVSRELIHMKADGLIKINHKKITLLKQDLWQLPPL